jgi:uncharacterized membrane protein
MVETPQAESRPKRRHSRLGATLKALVRTRITAGLLVVLPLYITWLVAKFVFGIMRDSSQWAVMALLENRWFQEHVWRLQLHGRGPIDVDQVLRDSPSLDWGLALFSVLLTILLLYAIGVFTANIVGKRLVSLLDLLLERVPLVKTVYRACKQILSTFAGEQKQAFQRVAMFPFLSPGVYSLGFVTSIFTDPNSGEEYVTIFYATTPNPTTGFVFILKRADIVELDWSIEEAVKAVMSGGIITPPNMAIPPGLRWREPVMPPGMASPAKPAAAAPTP